LAAVEKITGKQLIKYAFDLCQQELLNDVFRAHPDIDAIIHFAALKAVGESTEQPIRYHHNNNTSLINVLAAAEKYKVENFIFSSSCTVYGQTKDLPVTEETEMMEAESPYGRTKQIGEMILKDVAQFTDLNVISLRYFNPAGAHPSGLLGEAPKVQALNLVPVITETASGKREKCMVFGADYDTRDGSCVRDYIHIVDLADAHLKAVEYLLAKKNTVSYEVFNLGIGQGVTVLEAIHAFEKVAGQKLKYEIGPRRLGDVIAIYANYEKAKKLLGWQPTHDIDDIMKTAWQWELHRPF
jgi:UDP-glucose 4-epimerase